MTVDLNALSISQLVSLVQVRGQAIQFSAEYDQKLFEIAVRGDIDEDKLNQFMKAKDDLLAKLATAEERILAGFTASARTN